MNQNFEILINRTFSSETASIDSNLSYLNDYYLNLIGQTQDVVDSMNVRGFLSDEKNQKIVSAYYSFMTSSTLMNSSLTYPLSNSTFKPTAEFKAIYYNDEKLADSFNSFYNTSILKGLQANSTPNYLNFAVPQQNPNITNQAISAQLLNTSGHSYSSQTVYNNVFLWDLNAYTGLKNPFKNAVLDINGGKRSISIENALVEIPLGQNYFINVFLQSSNSQLSRMSFDICDDIIFKYINSGLTFSQNLNNKIKFDDYKNTTIKGADGSVINTALNYDGISYSTGMTANSVSLIQCFVDPNFKTNENELWRDGALNDSIYINSNPYTNPNTTNTI